MWFLYFIDLIPKKAVLFWGPHFGPETGTQRVSPNCRGSLFVFLFLGRFVGSVLGPPPVSMCNRKTVLIFGMFAVPKRDPDEETKQMCMEPWAGTDVRGCGVGIAK